MHNVDGLDRLFLTLAAAICGGSDKWRTSSPQQAQEPHGDQTSGHEQDRRAASSHDREVGRQRDSKDPRRTDPKKAALFDQVAAEHEQQQSAFLSRAQDRNGEIDKSVTLSDRDAPSIPRALPITSFSRRKGPEVWATEAAAANSKLAAAAVDSYASSVPRARDQIDAYLHNAASAAATSPGEAFSQKKSLKKLGRFIKSSRS